MRKQQIGWKREKDSANAFQKNRLFFINVIGDWLLPTILTQMGRFPPCHITDIVNKPY